MKDNFILRIATINDANQLVEIYKPYVENTAISFEYKAPSVSEFENRIKNTLIKYPFIVAEMQNKIVGYAYASAFKSREAYDRAVEMSIYVDKQFLNMGIGTKLYCYIEDILRSQGVLNANACIAYKEISDSFVTDNSFKFHKKCNYKLAGRFTKCGYKFNNWYDIIWMEKMLGEHGDLPKTFIPFSQLSYTKAK